MPTAEPAPPHYTESSRFKEQAAILAATPIDPAVLHHSERMIVVGGLAGLLIGGLSGALIGPGRAQRWSHVAYIACFSTFGATMGATVGLQGGLQYLSRKEPAFVQEFERLQQIKRIEMANAANPPPVLYIKNKDGTVERQEISIQDEDSLNCPDYMTELYNKRAKRIY